MIPKKIAVPRLQERHRTGFSFARVLLSVVVSNEPLPAPQIVRREEGIAFFYARYRTPGMLPE
jgi:hypothetical protein